MPTESDRIGHSEREAQLTARQTKFLPVLLASPTYTEACKAGRVSRNTLYEWLRQPPFKDELAKRRDELVEEGFTLLSQSVVRAVETLVGLLDGSDVRVRRLAAKDILDQHVKFKELADLSARIERIEERLEAR
jgi:hypothetical protein